MFKFVLILCVLLVPVGALFFGTHGCGSVFPQDAVYVETEDPDFRTGQELVAGGRDAEALALFQEIIRRHPNDSPESNMEAGLISFRRNNFPLAIYHFSQVLSLSPDAGAVAQKRVNELIDSAKKRYFQDMLPASANTSNVSEGFSVDLQQKYREVMLQNEQLKREIALLRERLASAGTPRVGGVSSGPASAVPEAAAPAEEPAPVAVAPSRPEPPPVPATHTVVAGDTLSSISKKYYGTAARWRDIYNANRVTMSSPSALRIGMVLKLPRP